MQEVDLRIGARISYAETCRQGCCDEELREGIVFSYRDGVVGRQYRIYRLDSYPDYTHASHVREVLESDVSGSEWNRVLKLDLERLNRWGADSEVWVAREDEPQKSSVNTPYDDIFEGFM
jgi:hypothetical protein